jgi:hypothetical protein
MTKIAIVTGSVRPGLNVANWVKSEADKRGDAEYEIVDIADYNFPVWDEPLPPRPRQVREAGHQEVGGHDRPVRRLCLRDLRVQPLDQRRAEERLGLPPGRVPQQGCRLRLIRLDGRLVPSSTCGASSPRRRSRTCATRSRCRGSRTSGLYEFAPTEISVNALQAMLDQLFPWTKVMELVRSGDLLGASALSSSGVRTRGAAPRVAPQTAISAGYEVSLTVSDLANCRGERIRRRSRRDLTGRC